MNRLEQVRETIDRILHRVRISEDRRCGYVHLYVVSQSAIMLALGRGVDAELAGVAGMLHDIVSYETGDTEDHATRSAERAGEILEELGSFSADEIRAVQSAIAHHSDKAEIRGEFEELLKDADVLQRFLYNPALAAEPHHAGRRRRLRERYKY